MTPIESFFQNVVIINLARRPDRWQSVMRQLEALGITMFHRFEAIDAGPDDGNRGCTASHKAVMKMIIDRGWERCLIFEDDFARRFEDVQLQFKALEPEIPADFDMLYLGGHYGTDPQYWHSKHLIRIGQMKTTSSYGVSLKAARELYELIPADTCDSIDNLYASYNESKKCFIVEPRFFVQYNNYSDLQKREMNNAPCMEDEGHVRRLGKYRPT